MQKHLLMYPPPTNQPKIFGISPKMRCFSGKRWEKLWIRWNWPFRVNLSLILGEKIENMQKWPFWLNLSHFFGQICNCGSFSAALVLNDLKKLENSKNLLMYPAPPCQEMKIFEISPKMRCFGGKRWEKLWIGWNWSFRVNLGFILGEKIENHAK